MVCYFVYVCGARYGSIMFECLPLGVLHPCYTAGIVYIPVSTMFLTTYITNVSLYTPSRCMNCTMYKHRINTLHSHLIIAHVYRSPSTLPIR